MGLFSMTKIVFQRLFAKPVTLMYPVKPAKVMDGTRGHLVMARMEDCIYCSLCAKHCPSQAIEVNKEERTWSLDRKRCINCNGCAEICPKDCLEMETGYFHPVLEGGLVTETIVGPPAEEPAKAQE